MWPKRLCHCFKSNLEFETTLIDCDNLEHYAEKVIVLFDALRFQLVIPEKISRIFVKDNSEVFVDTSSHGEKIFV